MSSLLMTAVHCPILPVWEDMTFDTQETVYATNVTYKCNDGYKFINDKKIKSAICAEDQKWYPKFDKCKGMCTHLQIKNLLVATILE